ncbi:DegT/DnrJ/EryC1/StrS family aminotransferase [Zavarzinella formosa]|uniref:DegT/DnrJ/EryC1/StrS family aminotransferase n=1 Tax=Zavarzinella formosa TaxID=360055 RepID=UPI0003172DE3|nr:DegT/DnrJ/EryC1/StrS family aminotransferase [Zavarzinella formosa]
MLPIAVPWVGEEEQRGVAEVIASGWLTQGPKVAAFEKAFAAACGTAEAVAVSNCTTALHLALIALDVGPGDEVICPSMSFIATANSIRHAGANPVFVEVDPRTYNLDPEATRRAITPRTKAIMPVHQVGMPADMDAFLAIGREHGLPILEDAACAIGSRYKGRPIGGDGVMACFSLHPRKIITTGDGGMITTNSEPLAAKLRLLRQHGMSVTDAQRHGSKQVVIESYLMVGYNYRMTDLQAAVGIAQMARLPEIISRRRHLADVYRERLASVKWIETPFVPEDTEPNFQSYPLRLKAGAPVSRLELMNHMMTRQISTRRGIMLAHREPPYAGLGLSLPVSEAASDESVLVPLYPQMTDGDVHRVCDGLESVVSRNALAS